MTKIVMKSDPIHAGAVGRNDPEDATRGGYLPTLDGWRAIAIGLVLIAHSGAFYFSPKGPFPSVRLQAYATRCGAGVDVFFAISGLLICSRLLYERSNRGTVDLKRFYARRAFRILPPYFAYLIVIAVCTVIGVLHVTPREFVASALFVRNYLPPIPAPDTGWYTGHFWSLAVEEHFYLLWPMIVLWLGRRSLRAAVFGILLVVTWRAVAVKFGILTHFSEMPAHRTDLRIDSLLWGCVAAFALSGRFRRFALRLQRPTLLMRSIWCLILVATVASFWRDNALTTSLRPTLLAYLVLATVLAGDGMMVTVLENKLLRWFGRLSYSIYIWQQLFFVSENVQSPPLNGRLRLLQFALPLTLAVATASYYLLEKPLISAGRRWFSDQSSSDIASISSAIPATSVATSVV